MTKPVVSLKLKDIVRSELTAQEQSLMVNSYDRTGDIAIIALPEALAHREKAIGKAILTAHSSIRVVARRCGRYSGEFRTAPLKIIAGERRKKTLVKEFGVRLFVDLEKAYFSPRSASERRRVAACVQTGESVLVMFSGIAPYPLLIAKCSRAKRIVGIEKNPFAHAYGLKNLQLNRNKDIDLLCGDVREVAKKLHSSFERIVMPLPTAGDRFLSDALGLLSPAGGVIHYYQMTNDNAPSLPVTQITEACKRARRELIAMRRIGCGHCGPRTQRICIDAEIGPKDNGKG
ncbi:MAG: hypothetical protein CSA20_06505 [Deltaproteobacteria bacterium]|nr:MAG: hypothetical protein CSA20_06505 [Deltaproteobacteria bacterium]